MDIKNVLNSVTAAARVSGSSARSSAALNVASSSAPRPSVQARQFIENVSSSTSYSAVEKAGLIEAVSLADQYISSSSAKQSAMADIANMGLYLKTTDTKEFPRWNLLTGLRYYGLNRDPEAKGITEQQAQVQVRQKLEQVASSRNMNYDDIAVRQAQKPEPVKVQETARMFGHAVQTQVKSSEIKAPAARTVDIKA